MIKKKFITSIFFAFLLFTAFGQTSEKTILPSVNGPAGNYIYIVNVNDLSLNEGATNDTDTYIIERIEAKSETAELEESDAKKIGELKRVTKYNQLEKYFSADDLDEIRSQYGDISKDQLIAKFTSFQTSEDLPFLYGFVETQQALGFVFLDDDVKNGYFYIYRIYAENRQGEKILKGYAYTKAGMGNYLLPHLRPKWTSSEGRDSMVDITWSLPIKEDIKQNIPLTSAATSDGLNKTLHMIPYSYGSLKAKLMEETLKGWKEKATIIPSMNADGNSLVYNYYDYEVGEEYKRYYLKLIDPVYNMGPATDTAIVYTVDSNSVEYIYNVDAKDTLNGVHLSWKKLPNKPYYAGIEIKRYDSEDILDTVTYLQSNYDTYLDRSMKIGQHYRYQVKALFVPQKGLIQPFAAQAVGTYTKFNKPLPPFDLKAKTVTSYVQLDWQSINEPSIYGYYVYRGTDPSKLELIDGPVKSKSYTDSLSSLSARTHYFYAVSAQNYKQDTSQYSDIVSIRPQKKIELSSPTNVNVYYANRQIHVTWRDTRTDDNIIEGFYLQRKKEGDSEFEIIHTESLDKPSYTDSNIQEGETYYYRVSSVSLHGDISDYSLATSYTFESRRLPTVNRFNARNIQEGIKINIPKMTMDNYQSFQIYRRKATEKEYTQIASFPSSKFDFVDDDVDPDIHYVYAVTIRTIDDLEGPRGRSVTVRRKSLVK